MSELLDGKEGTIMEEKKKATALTEEKSEAKTEEKKEEKKEAVKETAAEKPAESPASEAEDDEDDVDASDLFKRRQSIDLTPENARFTRSKGGMISLEIDGPEGVEAFERVIVLRSFPVSAPNEFLSVREPSTKKKGRGAEIGMIRRLSDFDAETQTLINEEMALRYFTPEIKKILSVKEKFGYSYWEAETTAGKVSFILNNPFGSIRVLEDKRVYIADMDGNSFVIPNPEALDRASYRRIEIYM